jgi:peroxiredoxin
MMKIKENDKIPNSEIFILENGEPKKKNIEEILKNKKVIIFGLPGAYTSVCSAKHLPGYVNNHDKFKTKGVDLIVCISVNDPFVMDAWGKSQNVADKILMVGDPFLNFTKAIGAEVDKSGRGLGVRSNRYTMFVDNMKVTRLQEEQDTGSCEISAAENFLKLV